MLKERRLKQDEKHKLEEEEEERLFQQQKEDPRQELRRQQEQQQQLLKLEQEEKPPRQHRRLRKEKSAERPKKEKKSQKKLKKNLLRERSSSTSSIIKTSTTSSDPPVKPKKVSFREDVEPKPADSRAKDLSPSRAYIDFTGFKSVSPPPRKEANNVIKDTSPNFERQISGGSDFSVSDLPALEEVNGTTTSRLEESQEVNSDAYSGVRPARVKERVNDVKEGGNNAYPSAADSVVEAREEEVVRQSVKENNLESRFEKGVWDIICVCKLFHNCNRTESTYSYTISSKTILCSFVSSYK